MELIIVYIALILIVTLIGNSRGRGGGTFFISLLLSPLIGLVWALAGSDGTKIQCPVCKELVQKGALKCKHCGNEFGETEV